MNVNINKDDISKLKISDIEKLIEVSSISELSILKKSLDNDKRKSCVKLYEKISKKLSRYSNEIIRIEKLYEYHDFLKNKYNYKNVLFIDEVGRGPLAGPVTVAGVVLHKNPYILGVKDSKKLTEKKRKEIVKEAKNKNIIYEIVSIDSNLIDKLNILEATLYAMKMLVRKIEKTIKTSLDLIVIDGDKTIKDIPNKQLSVIKGDEYIYGISLASIIAKDTRDEIMIKYDKIYPIYNFKKNKGYGTYDHIKAIKEHGICPIHRNSFLKNIL